MNRDIRKPQKSLKIWPSYQDKNHVCVALFPFNFYLLYLSDWLVCSRVGRGGGARIGEVDA